MNARIEMKIALIAVVALCAIACGYAKSEAVVTPMGSSASNVLIELGEKGFSIIIVGDERNLIIPESQRRKPLNGKNLADAIAKFHGLKVATYEGGAVLYPAVKTATPVINTAENAWRAGRARDIRAIPALIKAATSGDNELAWRASRALQRIGWKATLALGGDAAWDWRVAKADRSSYRGGVGIGNPKKPDYTEFLKAGGMIGKLNGEKSYKLLSEAANHWHRSIRKYAILAAGKLPAGKATRLLNTALTDKSRMVRECAIKAAGELSILPILEKALTDSSVSTRYCAVDALGMTKNGKAISILESLLTNPDSGMRRHALSSLAMIGGDKAFTLISQQASKKDGRLSVRQHAISCLSSFASEKLFGTISGFISESNSDIRFSVVSALGSAGSKALPLLAKALDDDDDRVCMQAMKSIGMIGGPNAAKLLKKMLEEDDEYFRAAAIIALGEVGGDATLTILQKSLSDSDSMVRATTAKALGCSGTTSAVALLEKAATDKDKKVRAGAAAALSNFNATDARVWALLEKLLADKDAYVCIKAIGSVKILGGSKTLGGLKKALSHSDDKARVAAIEAMGHLCDSAALPSIEPFLNDKYGNMYLVAVTAVGNIGDTAPLGKLGTLLRKAKKIPVTKQKRDGESSSEIKRRQIIDATNNAIVQIGGDKALTILGAELKATNYMYRYDYYQGLIAATGEIGGCDSNKILSLFERSLEKNLKNKKLRTIQHHEIAAMGRIQGANREKMLAILKEHTHKLPPYKGVKNARYNATRGLGYLGGKDLDEILTQAYKRLDPKKITTPNKNIIPIIDAANNVGTLTLLRTMAGELLKKTCNHYVETSLTVLRSFGDYACKKDIPMLEKLISRKTSSQGTDMNVSYAGAEVLGQIGGIEARDVFIRVLQMDRRKIHGRVRDVIRSVLTNKFPGDSVAIAAVKKSAATAGKKR